MPLIGQFSRTKSGYAGRVRTLSVDAEVVLVPADNSDAENAPDFRIHLGSDDDGPEIGAGWKRTGETAGDYVSLQIDDPTFGHPRSEEQTSALQSLMRISYAVFCLKHK